MWMRATGNSWGARDLLARRAVFAFRPSDPEEWYEALLTNAQAASNDRQWTTAYAIASRVDDAYAAGTDIRDQSLGERDDYRSEEHTSELQSLMRISYAVFCLKKKK